MSSGNGTRMGMVNFGENATLEIDLDDFAGDAPAWATAVSNMTALQGTANLINPLNLLKNTAFTSIV